MRAKVLGFIFHGFRDGWLRELRDTTRDAYVDIGDKAATKGFGPAIRS